MRGAGADVWTAVRSRVGARILKTIRGMGDYTAGHRRFYLQDKGHVFRLGGSPRGTGGLHDAPRAGRRPRAAQARMAKLARRLYMKNMLAPRKLLRRVRDRLHVTYSGEHQEDPPRPGVLAHDGR